MERKNATEMNKVDNFPLEKRNKGEPIRAALRLKRDARLDKMKELEWEHNTLVKWISTKRTRSSPFEMMREKSNITKPPEEMKEWNWMNGGKQDLDIAHLQQKLERSCWIINNERISLMWAYGRHLKIMRWQPATHREKIWLRATKDRKLLPPRW